MATTALAAAPAPWHTVLQARLAAAERAVAELQAACETPEAHAALEVRARYGFVRQAVAPRAIALMQPHGAASARLRR